MGKFIDISGKKFNKLLVIEKYGVCPKSKGILWKCICECNNKTIVLGKHLKNNNTTSCGCNNINRITTHGLSKTKEYKIWRGIKSRCYNENTKGYEYYGGRGIVMSDKWKESFETFYTDMGPRPSKNYSIDRIDVNGNYYKDNCRWANSYTQSNNKRNSLYIEYNGYTHTLSQWSNILGIDRNSLWARIFNLGWSVEKAFTEPPEVQLKNIVQRIGDNGIYKSPARSGPNDKKFGLYLEHIDGTVLTLPQWAKLLNINYECLRGRVRKGYTSEQVLFRNNVTIPVAQRIIVERVPITNV